MHIYFSGIGGTGIGPLALIAHQAGYIVSGSDKQHSAYIDYLKDHGITNIHIGQSREQIAEVHSKEPVDWLVYSSAVTREQGEAPPELQFCQDKNIKATKRDTFLSGFLKEKNLKLIAIAGTHGKTTTTAMTIWLFQQLGIPVSYSVGAKMSFGDMGVFDPASEYFVYEADEYDRNFLSFEPHLSMITGIDWDHPDIYPTLREYNEAFHQFLAQSEQRLLWQSDVERLQYTPDEHDTLLDDNDPHIDTMVTLPGRVNRLDAWQVMTALSRLTKIPIDKLTAAVNSFPGVARRFEQIAPQIYSDYAHTPPKIRGALQLAHEVAGDNVIVVYEGLHNTRQHFIKDELTHLFDDVKKLYIVPSYLAREDPNLALLSPDDLKALLSKQAQTKATSAALDATLKENIAAHAAQGELVLCITAGGGGSLDEWLRAEFKQ